MDLSFPLATIAPSLDAGVLQVLAATTTACSAAEVHRRLGKGSDEGVRRVLARLVLQGIVLVETPVRYPIYLLNREHLAAPHIERIANIRAELFDRLGTVVAGWAVVPIYVGLFGSFARGDADADSDIDLLFVRPETLTPQEEESWLEQLDRLDRQVRAWTGNAAQLVDITPATLERMTRDDDPLVASWRADEIPVHGERLTNLVRRFR